MKHVKIKGQTLTIKLLAVERDHEAGSAWRNGIFFLEDGTRIACGGGWIENKESANQKNEEAGIAGGLRQGVRYPNENIAGKYTPYSYGEDESGWESYLMPALIGGDWEDRDADGEIAEEAYRQIQAALTELF